MGYNDQSDRWATALAVIAVGALLIMAGALCLTAVTGAIEAVGT